jgi:hypothetical protein
VDEVRRLAFMWILVRSCDQGLRPQLRLVGEELEEWKESPKIQTNACRWWG